MVVEDENGCTNIVTENNVINVVQSPEPSINVDLGESCQLPVQANFLNPNIEQGVTYEWDFGNGELFSGAAPGQVEYTADGTYLVTLTASIDGCVIVTETEVHINTDPQLDFGLPIAKCIFNNFLISSNTSFPIDSIIWTTDTGLTFQGDDRTVIRIDEPGCYEFTAQVFINGCEYEYMFPDCIEIKDIPDLNFDIEYLQACDLPIIVDFSVDLPESANVNWLIDSPQGIIVLNGTNQSFEFTEEGVYGLAFEYIEGGACTHDYILDDIIIQEFEIIEPAEPIGGCIPINFNLDFSVNSASPVVFHEWSIPDLNINSNQDNLTVQLTDPGAYDVIYIVENADGCRDTLILEDHISGGNQPVTDFDYFPVEQCADEAFQLTSQSSDFANQWFWLLSDSLNTDWIFGEEILEIITDTGWIDIYHVAGQYGCFGDTVHVQNAIHVLGPGARFSIEQECNSADVFIKNLSIAADSFYFQISQGLDTVIVEQDSFLYSFIESGPADIELFTFNDSTGCEMNLLRSILIPDFDLGFVSDTVRGCVPLELSFNFQDNPLIVFATDHGVITEISDGQATVLYEEAGAYPSPYLLRYRDECIDTISIDSIFVNDVTASFTNDPIFCGPDDHQLTNTSSSIFGDIVSSSWTLDPDSLTSQDTNPVFYIDNDTLYSVQLVVEDSWSCVDTVIVPFTIKPRFLSANFEAQQLLCVGQEFQFNNLSLGNDIIEVEWDFGDGNTSNELAPFHSYDAEGLYDVCLIIVDNILCADTLCLPAYIEVRNPIADFIGDPTSIDCPPLFSNFMNESLYANEYVWDFGDNSGLSLLENPSHIYSEVGSFDVSLIASNNGLCPDTLILTDYINVEGPQGDWEFMVDANCIPLEVTFTGSSDGFYSYVWDFGNGEITSPSTNQVTDTISYTYNSAGVFIPKLLLDNNAGCIISVSGDTIIANDIFIDIDVGDSTYCVSPGVIEIDNNTTTTGEDISYSWQFDNGIESYFSDEANPEFTILNAGEYEIILLAETENCIDSLITDGVQIIDGITIEATNDTICYNELGSVDVEGDVSFFEWYTISGDFVGNSDSLLLQLTESQDFYVVGYRESCPNDTAFAFIEVYDPVEISLQTEYTSFGNQFPQVQLFHQGNYAFNWTPPGGLSCTTCPQPYIMPDTVSTYYVEVTDLDSGCSIDSLIKVETIYDCVEEGLYTPNIFSPNRDGTNDGVRVYTQRETDFISLSIFDRWGNLMFFSEDINQTWDGIYKSKPAMTGV